MFLKYLGKDEDDTYSSKRQECSTELEEYSHENEECQTPMVVLKHLQPSFVLANSGFPP